MILKFIFKSLWYNSKDMTNEFHHVTLLHETIDQLNVKPDGIYVDATLGGQGIVNIF